MAMLWNALVEFHEPTREILAHEDNIELPEQRHRGDDADAGARKNLVPRRRQDVF